MNRPAFHVICAIAVAAVSWTGSAWAQCSGSGEVLADTCDETTFEGCCAADGWTRWCEGGVLCGVDCTQNAPPANTCGWDPENGFYDCGHVGPDPSCSAPYHCDAAQCQDCGSITAEACCDGQTVRYCQCSCLHEFDCSTNAEPANQVCGWRPEASFYGCGGSGADPSGTYSIDCGGGPCVPDCGGKQCGSDGCEGSCGDCPPGYTCDGSGLCQACSCGGKQCGDDGCGSSCGSCDANFFCDPLGQCAACTCIGKACGTDDCGNPCGDCAAGFHCEGNDCVADCVANCSGKQCGDDGCGGTCGSCPVGQTCEAGACALPRGACGADPTETCQNFCGGPSDGTCYCDEACLDYGDCCPDYQDCCNGNTCTPDCTFDDCGDGGCPDQPDACGTCPAGDECIFGSCFPCIADCFLKDCGDDGCGGSCGTCPGTLTCENGTCVGGSGACGENPSQTCQNSCGDQGTGGCYCDDTCQDFGDCCPDYEPCCGGPCTPDCLGKECGSDGCSGSCGLCPAGETCQAGTCVPGSTGCNGISYEGCCNGQVVQFCEDGQLNTMDCSTNTPPDDQCGWKEAEGYYDCGGSGADPSGLNPVDCSGCSSDCTGKDCGDDGCGGSCGTCSAGQACQYGVCVACTPDCTEKECGDDGCGGFCGTCVEGYSCQDGACAENQVCVPDCAGKECGEDGCEGVCGVCVPPKTCSEQGSCYDPSSCTPDCTGKQCGSDGCAGSCGTCEAGLQCDGLGRCTDPTLPGTDLPGPGTTDVGQGPDPSGSQCPPGHVLYYGTCMPIDENESGDGISGSNCSIQTTEPAGSSRWLLILAIGLFAAIYIPRRS